MKKTLFSALALGIGCTSIASAQVSNWKNPAPSTEWTDPNNWTNGVPGAETESTIIQGQAIISSVVDPIHYIKVGATGGRLTIAEGGSLTVTGSARTRIAQSTNNVGVLHIDGGTLTSNGRVAVGNAVGTTATLILSNNGLFTTSGLIGLSNLTTPDANQTATLIFGGETTATAAGYIDAINVSGAGGGGTVNTVIFNHTNARYSLTKGATSSEGLELLSSLSVDAKSGVTVLTANNTYSQGTRIRSGATLLANTTANHVNYSSTGLGAVTVEGGGTLGGIGYVAGATTIAGTLKPGDYDYDAATASYATLKFKNDVTLLSTSTTEIAINGVDRGIDFSAFDIGGDLTLDGTLKVVLHDDFVIPTDGPGLFTLFNVGGEITAGFADFELPEIWQGTALVWDTTMLSTTGSLALYAQPIPEPSAYLMTALGLGAAGLFLRNRRTTVRS